MSISKTPLKPCPFCGGHVKYLPRPIFLTVPWASGIRGSAWTVECENCQANCGYETTEDNAIIRWNDRPGSEGE